MKFSLVVAFGDSYRLVEYRMNGVAFIEGRKLQGVLLGDSLSVFEAKRRDNECGVAL